ncbi:MAG: LptE family protein [Planctomycetes bacterium]|nr:LptE family protein [Planctomycetota bacterium]
MRYFLLPTFYFLLLSACGYQNTNYVKEVTTIAVPVFDNKTTYREKEFELTQLVQREIKARTPFRLVAKPEQADLVLKGEITDYRKPAVIEGRLDEVLAAEVAVTVNVSLIEQKSGKVLLSKNYVGRGELIPSRGQNEDSATARVYEDISQWVVSLLEE